MISSPNTTAETETMSGCWALIGCLPPGRALSQFKIDKPSFVIGRKTGVDLRLASHCVSGRHAEILQVGEHLFVRDLGSTNGTYVNRRRVRQPTPISAGDHIEIADIEFRVDYLGVVDSTIEFRAQKKTAQAMNAFDSDWTMSQFENLMQTRAITPHYQPVVRLDDRSIIGYEALARSTMCGLESPALLFQTAQLMNQEAAVSILCRQRAAEVAEDFASDCQLFINTHPLESLAVDVYPSIVRIRERFPHISMVVEIHEAAVQNLEIMRDFANDIRNLGVRLAYDDFGAGQSRLVELSAVPPDYLKFDAGLIRGIEKASEKHLRMLRMLIEMAKDSNAAALAEGVETAEEAEVCRDVGFDYGQGYYFGRPGPLRLTNFPNGGMNQLPSLPSDGIELTSASGACHMSSMF